VASPTAKQERATAPANPDADDRHEVTFTDEIVGGEQREPGCDDDEPRAEPDEPTEADWLRTLPVWGKLDGAKRLQFEREALCYRRSEAIRLKYASDLMRIVRGLPTQRGVYNDTLGPFSARHTSVAKSNHPKDWYVCRDCFGTGIVKTFGKCTSCFGHGFGAHVSRV
jgi:hypothetical protein